MRNPSYPQQGGNVRLFDVRSHWRTLLHRRAEHDPVIDGVRAFAIIWVIFFHLPFFHLGSFTAEALTVFTGPWTQWTSRGDMGVDLFFVISGYLIGTILLDEYRKTGSLQVKRFYARRFLRLIPVYVVAMLVAAPLVHNIPKSSILMEFPPWMNFDTIWANLFYVNNFLPINQQYMGWCWSLAIEEQFYLIFPAFILLFMRFRPKLQILGVMMLLSGVIRWMVIDRHGFIPPFLDTPDMQSWVDRFTIEYQNLYTRYAGLLSGVIGAYLMVYHRDRVRAFFTRTAMVNVLSVVAIGLIIPTAYFALASPHFAAIPRWASELYLLASPRRVFDVPDFPDPRRRPLGRRRRPAPASDLVREGAVPHRADLVLALLGARSRDAVALPEDRRALGPVARRLPDDGTRERDCRCSVGRLRGAAVSVRRAALHARPLAGGFQAPDRARFGPRLDGAGFVDLAVDAHGAHGSLCLLLFSVCVDTCVSIRDILKRPVHSNDRPIVTRRA